MQPATKQQPQELQIAALQAQIVALQNKVEDQAKTICEFQSAERKWQEAFEVLRAKKRAEAAPSEPQPSEPLARMFERAIDVLMRLDGVANQINQWPEKIPERTRKKHVTEVRDMLNRMRGLYDRVQP